jgi:hypothetical protein
MILLMIFVAARNMSLKDFLKYVPKTPVIPAGIAGI